MALNDEEEAALRTEFATFRENSVSKSVHKTRIDAKNTHIATLESNAAAAATKHTDLEGQFTAFKSKAGTDTLLGDNGVNNANARGLLMHRYNQLPEADRPELATWVGKDGAARSDSLVSHVFGTAADASAEADADPAKKEKKTTVPTPNKPDGEGEDGIKYTPEIVHELGLEDRIKNHDQIIKDLGF